MSRSDRRSIATARNPIIPGFHPDPSICRVGDDYYIVNSSFEYFPGVPIFHSRDLAAWRQIGWCLTRRSQLDVEGAASSAGIYAPTLRYSAGRFYMITTNVSAGHHLLVTAHAPDGPWSDPMLIRTGGIDPSLFCDDDGRVYLQHTGDGGIVQSELDVRTGITSESPRAIWAGSGGKSAEGPHMYKRDGWYHLLIAEGGTEYGHMVTSARSRSPWGPFEACPHNPLLTHRSIAHEVQCVGHADLVEAKDGRWWGVCLGTRPQGYPPRHHLGRETFLFPVNWTEDGWPELGEFGRLPVAPIATALARQDLPRSTARERFTDPLPMHWNHLRNPVESRYVIDSATGCLRLYGGVEPLGEAQRPTWLGRRQQHLHSRVETSVRLDASSASAEAGVTVWMNDAHHYDLAIGRGEVFVRARIGPVEQVLARAVAPIGSIRLRVESSPIHYAFSWSVDGETYLALSEAETRYLATEIAGGFTGVFFALYATDRGHVSDVPAVFEWCEYVPTGPSAAHHAEPIDRWELLDARATDASVDHARYPDRTQCIDTIDAGRDHFINVRTRLPRRNDIVYLRAMVDLSPASLLHLGHDGGCKVFVSGKTVYTQPRCLNPAVPGRAVVPLGACAGSHEIIIAFDRAGDKGWGFFASIESPALDDPDHIDQQRILHD